MPARNLFDLFNFKKLPYGMISDVLAFVDELYMKEGSITEEMV